MAYKEDGKEGERSGKMKSGRGIGEINFFLEICLTFTHFCAMCAAIIM